ncbi:MAG TPA: Gfo/Idh/MocA family oxidoreductase, partial [Mycobacteriales bacterium]|nr:Gfo/Idh/MocA family oxidoreductase [Mycobacteriales bacterium]
CEKPLTPKAAETSALLDLASERGRVLAEAFMYRHHPKTRELGALVASGELGEIHTIRASFNFWTDDPANDVRYSEALAGGALLDVGSYCVSLANYLLDDEPEEVAGLEVLASSGVEERFLGWMSYRSRCVATFDCSMRSPLSVGASVLGSAGEAYVAMPWYAHRAPHTIEVRYPDGSSRSIEAVGADAYYLETEDFAASVAGLKSPEVPPAETVRTLRTIERLRSSAAISISPAG